MAGRSHSFLTPFKESHLSTTEDEDTEEIAASRELHRTESTCTSPYLYRRSYISPFASVIDREDSNSLPSQLHISELQSESAIQRIKRESEEAKDRLIGLARTVQLKTEEIRSNSVFSSWETQIRKKYLAHLCKRLDCLLEDTRETEENLTFLMKKTVSSRESAGNANRFKWKSYETPANVSLEQHLRAVNSYGCALEGPEQFRQGCCSLLGTRLFN